MNKQLKTKIDEHGKAVVLSRGIEWTDATWNPVGGCQHRCRWKMPDGKIAVCYAESTANVMRSNYPQGFEHHYWNPHRLDDPFKHKLPARIFLDSMSDLMGNWVPEDQIKQVFDACRRAHWHHFQLLTKNAPRLLKFEIPENVWVGVSAPPTFMFGRELTSDQQRSMVFKQLDTLRVIKEHDHPICWMSIEPLSFDITDVFSHWLRSRIGAVLPLDWAVIGAASNGNRLHQPAAAHVHAVHEVLRAHGTRIFHKGNLQWDPHLEEFPLELKQEVLL